MSTMNKTSFCGLWCGDCIPANEKIYELASIFRISRGIIILFLEVAYGKKYKN